MENQRTLSYQQAADELRDNLINIYNKKIFPRMGKIFADQLFLAGIEAGGFLSALGDIDEIHVKRDIAQSALIRLKRADYILKTMLVSGYYTAAEAEQLQVFFNKIIPAVRALIVEVYNRIAIENEKLYGRKEIYEETAADDDEHSYYPEELPSSTDDGDADPEGFYKLV